MSRLSDRFAALRQRGEGALVLYLVAGDPSLEETGRLLSALAEAGTDVIELGVPFSDPIADGPAIQASAQRALAAGASLAGVLQLAAKFRARHATPLVLMTYFNPVYQYGLARFAADAANVGVDGFIITDLPPEEAKPWLAEARDKELDTVFLVAPTSTPERIAKAAAVGSGFLYCVSRMGVTGARAELPRELTDQVVRIRAATDLPIAVGFGISTPDQVRAVCGIAEGAVVGSALVELITAHADSADLPRQVAGFARSLKAVTRRDG